MKRLNLARLSRITRSAASTHYGDPCPCANCCGHIGVYCTQHAGGSVIRWLECKSCGWKPPDSKWVSSPPIDQSHVYTMGIVQGSIQCMSGG